MPSYLVSFFCSFFILFFEYSKILFTFATTLVCEHYNLRIYRDSIGNAIVGVNANKNGTLQFVLLDFKGKILTPKYDFIGDFKESLFICNIGGNCQTENYSNDIGAI